MITIFGIAVGAIIGWRMAVNDVPIWEAVFFYLLPAIYGILAGSQFGN